MASQVLSGASNASYTNNTGQNVRLIINYMSNVTSMTWAEVTVTASSTTIGKDIQNVTGELRSVLIGKVESETVISGNKKYRIYDVDLSKKAKIGWTNLGPGSESGKDLAIVPNNAIRATSSNPPFVSSSPGQWGDADILIGFWTETSYQTGGLTQTPGNYVYVPTTISRGGNFPVEIMLANGESFSSVCGAYNVIAIKEDGT